MTCDHPACSDDQHKTYSDEHDNDLELCEAHYYYLVSGKKPSALKPDRIRGFEPSASAPVHATPQPALDLDSNTGRENPFSIDQRER